MPGGTVKYSIVADAKPFVDATQQASKELGKLTDQAVGSAGSLGSIAAAAGPMGKALAVATGLGVAGFTALAAAVADSVKGLVETGAKLSDLSAQTGISTQALQKLSYAGSLVGVSQEQIAVAAAKMEKAIANGSDVFERLGLSVQKLKAMQPDQAFAAIASQIARIKNPADQAAAAMEVFGKSGATLLPLIKTNLKEAGEEAERLGIILSDKTVIAADALDDEAQKLAAAWEGVKNQFAAAIVENPALLAALQGVVGKMGDLAQWLAKNKGEIASFTTEVVAWGTSFVGWIEKVASKLIALGNNPAVKFLNSVVLKAAAYATGAAFIGGDAGGPSAGSGTGHMAAGSSYAAIKGAAAGVHFDAKGSAAEIAAADKAWQAARKKFEADEAEHGKIVESIRHETAMRELKADEAFWKQQVQMADDYGRKLLEKILKEQADAAKAKEGHAFIAQYAIEQEAKQLDKSAAKWQTYGDVIATVAGQIGGPLGSALGGLGSIFDGLAAHQRQASENLINFGDKAMTSAQKLQAAATAAAAAIAIYQDAAAGKSAKKGAISGAAKGAAVGTSIMPGWGTAIGAVAGGIIGFFGGKKGQNAELKELRGEFDALMAKAQAAGTVLQHAFDPRNAQQYKQAIDEIQRAMDIQGEAQEKLNDAVQRYGFTIDELGPVMQRQELDKQAGQLYQDWMLLNQAGIDHNAIIERMGPSINEYVQNAIAAGGEIPAAFKPIIDDLISQGKLLDANGNAYTSAEAAGITYAQTMSQMFQDLIKHVEELVNAIRGVPDKTATITVRTVREGGGGGDDTSGGDDSDGGRVRGYASGGVFMPRAGGHLARIAEGGQPEAVVNPQQMAALMGSGSPEAVGELRRMNDQMSRLPNAIGLAVRDMIMVGR